MFASCDNRKQYSHQTHIKYILKEVFATLLKYISSVDRHFYCKYTVYQDKLYNRVTFKMLFLFILCQHFVKSVQPRAQVSGFDIQISAEPPAPLHTHGIPTILVVHTHIYAAEYSVLVQRVLLLGVVTVKWADSSQGKWKVKIKIP